jgi:long-chain acyl-CoA synthetase
MIVTEGGKNIYPEDIETFFEGLPVKEFCVFAENFIWPKRALSGERLVMALHLESGQQFTVQLQADLAARNRRLADFKRLGGCILWERDFPRTASMKIRREELAAEIGKLNQDEVVLPL